MSKFNCTLTHDRLKERLYYDPETGIFRWIKTVTGVKISDSVGYVNKFGYRIIMFDKINYQAHRLAWLYVNGTFPDKFIDHINGVKTDNRICNLRQVNKSENGQNQRKTKSGSSTGLLGVSKHGKNGWRAKIYLNGQATILGTFKSPELAHEKYLEAKRKIHPMGML